MKLKQTPMRAIRSKCLECSGGSAKEVRVCPVEKCPLYAYRFGHRPAAIETDDTGDFSEKSAPLNSIETEREAFT